MSLYRHKIKVRQINFILKFINSVLNIHRFNKIKGVELIQE